MCITRHEGISKGVIKSSPQYAKTGDGAALRGLLSGGKLNVQHHLVVQCEQVTSVLMAGLKYVEEKYKTFCTAAFHCIPITLYFHTTYLLQALSVVLVSHLH